MRNRHGYFGFAAVVALVALSCSPSLANEPGALEAGESSPDPASFPGAGLINAKPPFLTGVVVDREDGAYQAGDLVTVSVQAEADAYLYLLYHQADGSTLLLYPNEAARENRVPAGTRVRVPAEGSSFRFRIQPPFGDEVLQILATREPAPELAALVKREGKATAVTGEVLQELKQRLSADRTNWAEQHVRIRTAEKRDESERLLSR